MSSTPWSDPSHPSHHPSHPSIRVFRVIRVIRFILVIRVIRRREVAHQDPAMQSKQTYKYNLAFSNDVTIKSYSIRVIRAIRGRVAAHEDLGPPQCLMDARI